MVPDRLRDPNGVRVTVPTSEPVLYRKVSVTANARSVRGRLERTRHWGRGNRHTEESPVLSSLHGRTLLSYLKKVDSFSRPYDLGVQTNTRIFTKCLSRPHNLVNKSLRHEEKDRGPQTHNTLNRLWLDLY